jgi:hypothetical protein
MIWQAFRDKDRTAASPLQEYDGGAGREIDIPTNLLFAIPA